MIALPVLPGAPWLVAHRSMLGINRPYKLTLNGRDYVLWQNTSGEIQALDNSCPHMQAPLSEGWICADRETLACPFHALEFDGRGCIHRNGSTSHKPSIQTLDLIMRGDLIWTYGNHPPQLPIPEVPERLTAGLVFMGAAGEKHIQADFLQAIKINYDFNHVCATHREPFRIRKIGVRDYEERGYYSRVTQDVERDRNTWQQVLKNPALLTVPQRYSNYFEYAFPSTTGYISDLPVSRTTALFILYPETENRTKTFVLVYAETQQKWLVPLLRKSVLDSFSLVIEQDTTMLEQCYSPAKPQIRLPNENIMFYAERLYQQWPTLARSGEEDKAPELAIGRDER